jgi:RimJ/RimL family protein N-acetyltransferase
MEIRLIKEEDYELLAAFFSNNDIVAITRFFTPFPLTRKTARWIACEEHQDKYYFGIVDEAVIGFSMLRGWEEGYSIPSFGMFIDNAKHGLGYGKQLLDLTIDAASQLGCAQVRLSVRLGNQPAYRIYKSRGFKEIERTELVIKDTRDEKIIMIKDLN